MSSGERIRIHSRGTECKDGHGNKATFGAEKKEDFESVKHWSVGIGILRQLNLNRLNKHPIPHFHHLWTFSVIKIAITGEPVWLRGLSLCLRLRS